MSCPTGRSAGVPFLVKDMDGFLADEPCTFSSRSLRDYVPNHDSELFARYRRAGVVFVGKTNCPEFGIYGVTEPEFRGPARNPWNTDHTPGGSSGGSSAAVAAGIVPVAHAGDGGGSIRIPASACGLFGLMPSRGRTPLGPDEGEGWNGLVRRHVVSRTVRDSAAFLDATQGDDVGAPYAAPPAGDFLAAVGRDSGAPAHRLLDAVAPRPGPWTPSASRPWRRPRRCSRAWGTSSSRSTCPSTARAWPTPTSRSWLPASARWSMPPSR